MNEFEIIDYYFSKQKHTRSDVLVGIGDDAAIVKVPHHHQLVVTTDTLVSGIHFFENANAYDIGYKSLAVNLSDIAAMGATPAWVTLALTLPQANETWLLDFTKGFFALGNQYNIALIGGDLTHGPLSVSVQAMGFLPDHQSLLRSKAKPNDIIYVTGNLGDAGLALAHLKNEINIPEKYLNPILDKLNRPQPRIEIGQQLINFANAAIDLSDGLIADLSHLLKASNVGAEIVIDQLPLSAALTNSLARTPAISLALTAGDNYELLFTVPPAKRALCEKALSASPCGIKEIGRVTESPTLIIKDEQGNHYPGIFNGYQHFS